MQPERRRFLGITVMPEYVQVEGVEAVIGNLNLNFCVQHAGRD